MNEDVLGEFAHLSCRDSLAPVSYTHLDVYKRQTRGIFGISRKFHVEWCTACRNSTIFIFQDWVLPRIAENNSTQVVLISPVLDSARRELSSGM